MHLRSVSGEASANRYKTPTRTLEDVSRGACPAKLGDGRSGGTGGKPQCRARGVARLRGLQFNSEDGGPFYFPYQKLDGAL